MIGKQKRHSAGFKAKVAPDALNWELTLSQCRRNTESIRR